MNKNWMSALPDELFLSEIVLPGTHDSCTYNVKLRFFRCQDRSIREQLKLGIRYVDIRVEFDGKRLKTVHSVVDCKKSAHSSEKLYADDVIEQCTSFLAENPQETVVFCLKRDDGVSPEETFDAFYSQHLQGSNIWFCAGRIPTLGEVRGRIVLLNRCTLTAENRPYNDGNCGLNLSKWPQQDKADVFACEKIPVSSRETGAETAFFLLQDHFRLSKRNKWEKAVLPLLEKPPQHGLLLNFFSANNGRGTPRGYAHYIYRCFRRYELEHGKKYGWLIFDFPTEEVVDKVIASNF